MIILILILIFLNLFHNKFIVNSYTISDDSDCPVCLRVIRAIRDLAESQKIGTIRAFENYCAIKTLELDDQKFCYNTESIKKDLFRLIDLGADEFRICKRVKKENPDFCKVKQVKTDDQGVHFKNRRKRGVIYI